MAADIGAVREHVGSTPDDETIGTTWLRFADATYPDERTALAILRKREADMVDRIEKYDIDGDYAETKALTAVALKVVQGKIGRLERITGDTAGAAAKVLASAPICAPGDQR